MSDTSSRFLGLYENSRPVTGLVSPFLRRAQCQAAEEPSRQLTLANASDGDEVEFGSLKYYALCGFGGILSCGITHTALTPLDLVKCRIQVNPEKYKGTLYPVT